MNVFILNSGRCGSTTFIKSCQHIKNYTAAHESLITKIGAQRLDYPVDHIEADNRLSWFLGRLDRTYGETAYYVHLTRNKEDSTTSLSKRIDFGIMKAYEQGILMHGEHEAPAHDIAGDYIDTIESNIKLFLRDKTNKMDVSLENIRIDYERFWTNINASGDLKLALKEWDINYNAS